MLSRAMITKTEMSRYVQIFLDKVNNSIFGDFAEFVDNVLTLWPLFLFIAICLFVVITFRKRVNKSSGNLLATLSRNRKYIRGLFVELNDTKELMRYFINGRKWKKRIIEDYNLLFDDEYGNILKKVYKDKCIYFQLKKSTSINKVYEIIIKTLELMNQIRLGQSVVPEEYKETILLFLVYGHQYIEKLEKLKTRAEFIKNKYIVLTGSAGNGKTNLLCNLVEMLIDTRKICIFMDSKEIPKNVTTYFYKKLSLWKSKPSQIFWIIYNLWCLLCDKTIYIIIEAVNENESQDFIESLPDFINYILKFPKVKLIISCRSEYFDLKYKSILVDKINMEAYCYNIMKEKYSVAAKERIYENYKETFNFRGEISSEVKEKLYKQLLLMRMFFEVNKDSNANINNLNKYEIFQKYIDSVMGEAKNECEHFFKMLVEFMYKSQEYSSVKLSDINEKNYLSETVKDMLDETILLSRKLVLHPNSIREIEDEEIYFVFDEMRDYCIAKYVLNLMSDESDNTVDSSLMNYMEQLVEENCVCKEGVINYIYWYYKNNNNVYMCTNIMEKFIKPHDCSMNDYRLNRESGLNSWGLKIIFENNEELQFYEKEYIKFIIIENPGNELSRMFAFLVHQEEVNGKYNIGLFLSVLFEIHQINKFCDVLKETVVFGRADGISIDDFISIDKTLLINNKEGSERFRLYMFLVLHCLQWENKEKLKEYFEYACDDEKIKQMLRDKIYFEEEKDES